MGCILSAICVFSTVMVENVVNVDVLTSGRLTHLQRLEAEAIQIMREAVSESDRPAMLYSIGKDSSVMLHLARKAFYPSIPPFPLVHVDTTWKFSEMYAFRDNDRQGRSAWT